MTVHRVIVCMGAIATAATLLAARELPAQERTKEPRDKPRRDRIITDLSGFDLLDTMKVKTQAMAAGATRSMGVPTALAPRLGEAYGTNPLFAWSHEGQARRFVFIVWNDTQEEVYRAQVPDKSFRYPPDAPPLEPGKAYSWTVAASAALLGAPPSAPVGILVVSFPERESIQEELARIGQEDPYAQGLERARVFTRHRVWYDAIAEYTDLIARYPDRAELFEERGMIYAQLQVTQALAEADFAHADELTGEKP